MPVTQPYLYPKILVASIITISFLGILNILTIRNDILLHTQQDTISRLLGFTLLLQSSKLQFSDFKQYSEHYYKR